MCLGFCVVKSFVVFSWMRTVVWMTDLDVHVGAEGSGGWRWDVCPAFLMMSEDGGIWSDVVEMAVEPEEGKPEPEECDLMLALVGRLDSWTGLQLEAFLDSVRPPVLSWW